SRSAGGSAPKCQQRPGPSVVARAAIQSRSRYRPKQAARTTTESAATMSSASATPILRFSESRRTRPRRRRRDQPPPCRPFVGAIPPSCLEERAAKAEAGMHAAIRASHLNHHGRKPAMPRCVRRLLVRNAVEAAGRQEGDNQTRKRPNGCPFIGALFAAGVVGRRVAEKKAHHGTAVTAPGGYAHAFERHFADARTEEPKTETSIKSTQPRDRDLAPGGEFVIGGVVVR